ncbi:MAG: right-handed parallel beta-helix repeat-containing protein [Chitinophagaceae bacterium]
MKRLIALLLLGCPIAILAQEKMLVTGMKITRSVKIKKAVYRFEASADTSRSVIIIEGDDLVIDFNQAELRGSPAGRPPDEYAGVAIMVRNSRHVVIRNLKARGYKVALLARNSDHLVLENCDLSYNYRPHLNSTQEREDISDWMSYHHNEKDEWLRYGAAIYLRDCDFATIRNCRVTGGQNALMMTACDSGLVVNNDFSFNSGIGIGMYRSSYNQVLFNRVIFNVRGYSHGVYNRGQDSAGMLVYEQSNNNLFYRNNVTHGGDGFFLWAGQTTMDTGTGGCNDNLLYGNDFSYAPTNGIEVTFSRNRILRNRVFECDHGIWGGYSFSTVIGDNKFGDNRIAIAIEHGQDNTIAYNLFMRDKEAIRLWARKEQPADWIYAQKKDTRSRNYFIFGNSFNANPVALNLSRSNGLQLSENAYSGIETILKTDSTVTGIDSLGAEQPEYDGAEPEILVKDPSDPFKGSGKWAGRKNIMITEWGPYDFRYPLIWNTNPADTSMLMRFDLLGPPGKWVIKNARGLSKISASQGSFPASITAERIEAERTDILIEVEYTGPSFTTAWGEKLSAGKPFLFRFRKFFQPVSWEVLFYRLDTAAHNPLKEGTLFSMTERIPPFRTERKDRLDYAWWGGLREGGVQYPRFITVAHGDATFPPGKYELSVTWDDAVRIFIDNKKVVDEWVPSRYVFDESPHKKVEISLGGSHHFRVEHLELGGFASLSLKIKPVE